MRHLETFWGHHGAFWGGSKVTEEPLALLAHGRCHFVTGVGKK